MQKLVEYSEGLKTKIQLLNITNYPLHMHPRDLQILYILKGELDLHLSHAHYYLQKDSIHIIHSEDVHAIKSITPDNLVVLISINTAYYSKYFPNLDNIIFTSNTIVSNANDRTHEMLADGISALISEQCNALAGYETKIKEKTISLLTVLTNYYRGFSINTNKRFEHKTAYDLMQINRISNIVSYIYEYYYYKLSLSDLAEQENLSLYYLSHLFQRFVGISFRDFLSMARVEMSEYELLSTNHSISMIAQNVGFSSSTYYVENFHYWFGVHPKTFRQMFADKRYGIVEPEFEEKSFGDLSDTLSPYAAVPVYDKSTDRFKLIDVDIDQLPQKSSGKIELDALALRNINQNFFNDIMSSMPRLHYDSLSSLYCNGTEQAVCIDFLKKIVSSGTIRTGEITFMDTPKDTNGILTINGMKKPMYHLLSLLNSAGDRIADLGPEYFITLAKDGSLNIVVFNESTTNNLKIDFNLLADSGNYKITERKIRASCSCISYWFQLNFTENLDEKDIADIESMSIPAVSFHMLTPADHYYYTCFLEPQDIAFINVRKQEEWRNK